LETLPQSLRHHRQPFAVHRASHGKNFFYSSALGKPKRKGMKKASLPAIVERGFHGHRGMAGTGLLDKKPLNAARQSCRSALNSWAAQQHRPAGEGIL
jgi:hypothetical protein